MPTRIREATETTQLACPGCRGPLRFEPGAAHCDRCTKSFPRRADWVDFIPEQQEALRGIGPALMHLPVFARVYEGYWRPAFVRVAGGSDRPSFDEEYRWVLDRMEGARGGPVLDLSCGPGLFGRRLAQSRQFSRVYGIDHSDAMLHQCVDARARAGGEDLELVRADAAYLPLADESIGAVHAGAALHLWPSPSECVSEVARVLRPGGVFVASTFVRSRGRHRKLLADVFQAVSHARVFPEAVLRNMCRAVGLDEFEEIRHGAFILFAVTKR